ncbi:M14 family metallopeptidase [Jidongwangia harbinensis]|uniref:M14 family metallopeptidase n=1 Tax=Jidongwangia harbinensis TaxID=2878561 RepID=UPI001CDA3E8C|nr:M14 family metallopeptidase [Jidongwangia harbinensis]MCA2214823.1 immune inhibitor A [Jidongwangia harbinensis]
MRTRRWVTAGAAALLGVTSAIITGPSATAAPPDDSMKVYVGTLDGAQLDKLRHAGVDNHESVMAKPSGGKVPVEAVLTGRQAERLIAAGVPLTAKRPNAAMRSRAAAGPTVFRQYNAPGGLRDELAAVAARNPTITKLVTLGTSLRGVPIQAVKVTKGARNVPDGARPSVLYAGAQHAREWITPEMNRRLLHHVVNGYGTDATLTNLVNTTELWFLPVANPDGYDFTFTEGNRLWRKNLRDNDGNGEITTADGVDLNRNFAEKWGWDNEGSSPDPADQTYRGPSPNSEPETQALNNLFRRVGFEFFVNYHSAAELLLYGIGWQVNTPLPDDQISIAMAGDDAHPAVPGYDPDISAELYTTNGDTDTHAQVRFGTIGFTPEMTTCQVASGIDPDDQWNAEDCESGFNFPDDERLIQQEFEKNIPFALSVARSAKDPANPVSAVGWTAPDLQADPFEVSYGKTQPVAVLAERKLKDKKLHYRINNGAERTGAVKEWQGGERYGETHDKYFAEFRGTVRGAKPGDKVTVWFTATGAESSEPFTYTVASDIGGDVLVLAAEDVTGVSPANPDGATSARYADEHVASIEAAGHSADVYDMDTRGRKAPHHLGVLSHYKAVVWETGDDTIPRATGQPAGTAARSTLEVELALRDYLNEGGKLLFGGKYAGFAQGSDGQYVYQPNPPAECTNPDDVTCLPLFNDFQQYWLGAYSYISDGGTGESGPFPLIGREGRFEGFTGTLNGPGSAGNQNHTAAFLSTSSYLPADEFPQFASQAPVDWQQGGAAPYDPFDGDWYLYSGQSDVSWKRLTKTVNLTSAESSRLKFQVSHDIEVDWDYMFVEAHVVGSDDWTTLPDANGHTQTGTGESCRADSELTSIHPFIAHYQGEDCSPTGTTGTWNAATGNSGGWQEWDVDLSAYAGKQVEVSISYMSDWGTQGLGVLLDDVRVEVDGAVAERTSFEGDLGGWTVAGPPPGTAQNLDDWRRSQQAFDTGAVTTTADTVFLGFGLEGLPFAERTDFVKRALRHLKI